MADRRWQAIEHQVDLSAEQVDVRDRARLVDDVFHLRRGQRLEHLGRQVDRAAGAGGRIGQLAGVRLRMGDQFRHALHRQRRAHHQHVGHRVDLGDRREGRRHVVGHVAEQETVHRQRAGRTQDQGMAVRGRLHAEVGTRVAATARPVVDEDGLAERLGQRRHRHARDHVGDAAGAERNDHADRTVRIGTLREGLQGQRTCGGGAQQRHCPSGI